METRRPRPGRSRWQALERNFLYGEPAYSPVLEERRLLSRPFLQDKVGCMRLHSEEWAREVMRTGILNQAKGM